MQKVKRTEHAERQIRDRENSVRRANIHLTGILAKQERIRQQPYLKR